jgi:hypothetical protein
LFLLLNRLKAFVFTLGGWRFLSFAPFNNPINCDKIFLYIKIKTKNFCNLFYIFGKG